MNSDHSFLGVLMLDTAFPRIVGDAGNAESYPFSVRFAVIDGAGSLDIVRDGPLSPEIIASFCKAAKMLEQHGAFGIVSTCGFLIQIQRQIAASVNIPVMVSALSLFPIIRTAIAHRPIGIITASKRSLGTGALKAADILSENVEIGGLETCPPFADTSLRSKKDQPRELNRDAIEKAVVAKAMAIQSSRPDLRAFLIECGNFPPYANAIRAATGHPVFSIIDAAKMIAQTSKF